MPAVVYVRTPGPTARLVCDECDLAPQPFARTKPAQAAAAAHNLDRHPKPDQEEPA